MVLDAARTGDALAVAVRRIGPALLFERLWQETGCHSVITALARGRGHRFSLERAVFLSVLHRHALAARIWPPIAGARTIASPASMPWSCTISTVRWPGLARHSLPIQQFSMRQTDGCGAPCVREVAA